MKRIIYHILIPAVMPALFFRIASTPVEVLGCRTRGLMALSIAFISGLAALGTSIGAKRERRGDPNVIWWIASTFILVIPVIAMIILA
jgi:ABC-type thiamin/hydroxymethylpyrimidine transport system permease subunit